MSDLVRFSHTRAQNILYPWKAALCIFLNPCFNSVAICTSKHQLSHMFYPEICVMYIHTTKSGQSDWLFHCWDNIIIVLIVSVKLLRLSRAWSETQKTCFLMIQAGSLWYFANLSHECTTWFLVTWFTKCQFSFRVPTLNFRTCRLFGHADFLDEQTFRTWIILKLCLLDG